MTRPAPLSSLAFVRRSFLASALAILAFAQIHAQDTAPANARPDPNAKETVIELSTVGGLRFDPPRFAVPPGAKVKILIQNVDDMAHNFVLLKPGARMEIVTAANLMPVTPGADFIPKSDKVIQHSPLLIPSKKATVTFTAPTKEDVYPYVCTFPGHGLIMYGAMYVTTKPMPPLAKDMNLPEIVRDSGDPKKYHAFAPTPPYLYRTFVRDCGPAAIAVCLPSGQNYCWDAGACRLRYVWKGAFLDPMPHWAANGDAFSEVKGRIYYRTQPGVPLHVGNKDKTPAVKFLGYRLVQKFPEFHYLVDGVDVRELTKPLHHGSGIESTFTVAAKDQPLLYTFNPNGGATVASSAGTIKDGVLTLTPEQAKSFTITFTEVPGREPLRYWSMNDTLNKRKIGLVEKGLSGRAANFYGNKGAEYETDVNASQLTNGVTFAAWIIPQKPQKPKPSKDEAAATAPTSGTAAPPAPETPGEQVVLGITSGPEYFYLGWNLGGSPGIGLAASAGKDAQVAKIITGTLPNQDKEWHHLAFTFAAGTYTLYLDGQPAGTAKGAFPAKGSIFLGSSGGSRFAAAYMDEARVDDRAYAAAEIAALYKSESPAPANTPAK
jgi:uncharacterized cupredoxin-like copper-binding protein